MAGKLCVVSTIIPSDPLSLLGRPVKQIVVPANFLLWKNSPLFYYLPQFPILEIFGIVGSNLINTYLFSTVKDLKSKFEFNAQYVIEGKEKMELIAVCKMKLEEIEPNVFVKKTFDLLQKKDKKRIAGLNLKFKYEPYEAIEEDDEQSEVDFENQSPIGRLTVDSKSTKKNHKKKSNFSRNASFVLYHNIFLRIVALTNVDNIF